jgi:hypothetical protein
MDRWQTARRDIALLCHCDTLKAPGSFFLQYNYQYTAVCSLRIATSTAIRCGLLTIDGFPVVLT